MDTDLIVDVLKILLPIVAVAVIAAVGITALAVATWLWIALPLAIVTGIVGDFVSIALLDR